MIPTLLVWYGTTLWYLIKFQNHQGPKYLFVRSNYSAVESTHMSTSLTVPSGSPTRAACRYISNFYFEDKKFTKMHREY